MKNKQKLTAVVKTRPNGRTGKPEKATYYMAKPSSPTTPRATTPSPASPYSVRTRNLSDLAYNASEEWGFQLPENRDEVTRLIHESKATTPKDVRALLNSRLNMWAPLPSEGKSYTGEYSVRIENMTQAVYSSPGWVKGAELPLDRTEVTKLLWKSQPKTLRDAATLLTEKYPKR